MKNSEHHLWESLRKVFLGVSHGRDAESCLDFNQLEIKEKIVARMKLEDVVVDKDLEILRCLVGVNDIVPACDSLLIRLV